MRFVQNHKVIRENEAGWSLGVGGHHFICQGEQSEEKCVVEHDYLGFLDAAAGCLVGAVVAAVARGAYVVFAAYLGPHFGGDAEVMRQFGQRAFAAIPGPGEQVVELPGFCLVEEVVCLFQGAAQAGATEVVGAAFEQGCIKMAVESTRYGGDVLVEELLLQVDGVGGDDGFAPVLQRKTDGGDEVGE